MIYDDFLGLTKGSSLDLLSLNLFGTSTRTEEIGFTYSPSTSSTFTYSPQTTTATTTTETITYAPKKTTYYAPVLMLYSPYATAKPTFSENAPLSVSPSTMPYILPSITTETRTSQPQLTAKTETTTDETMKWILIGGAVLLVIAFIASKKIF